MPAVSKAQLIAMRIAAAGKSNLGIPKSVGEKFVEETPKGAHLPARKHSKDNPGHNDPEGEREMESADEPEVEYEVKVPDHKAHLERHARMAKEAPTHASRAFHRKMAEHYHGKMKRS